MKEQIKKSFGNVAANRGRRRWYQRDACVRANRAKANRSAQETVRSVVAKQATLVSEFEVNGLKVLLKRREGSLTVAAGLFIRGGSANINAQNAGIETLMLSVATEATANFPRAIMRSRISRAWERRSAAVPTTTIQWCRWALRECISIVVADLY